MVIPAALVYGPFIAGTEKGVGDWKRQSCFRPNGGGDMSPVSPSDNQSSVELVESMGEWSVRVDEGTGAPQVATFGHKDYAVSYSEGQAIRLGVAVRHVSE